MKKFVFSAFADEASELLHEQIDAMKENGVEMLEIRGVNGRNISDMTKGEVLGAKYLLDLSDIKVWSIGSPIGKIAITDDLDKHFDKFKKTMEYAHLLDAKCFRLFSFFNVDTPEKENEVIAQLGRYCEYAKGSGVTLCHENEKEIFGDVAAKCVRIHEALPELPAVFDPANFIQCSQDVPTAWEMLKKYVKYMHIKDARADGSIVPAGKGLGHLPEILASFASDTETKVLSVEPHLKVFSGLAGLEGGDKGLSEHYEYGYPDNRTAFSAAVSALKEVIKSI